MAYADKRHSRPSAASIGGALAINGLMIAGIILAAPDILPKEPWKIIDTYWVTPDPVPTPPTKTKQPPVKTAARNAFVPVTPPTKAKSEETEIATTTTGTGIAGGTGGTGITEQPPIAIQPVLTGARINPRYAGTLQPAYPPGMIREEREGVVTVRVLIGTDGRVKSVEAIRADDAQFLDATRRQALSKWRFLPATRDGSPIESWREMTVRFELPD